MSKPTKEEIIDKMEEEWQLQIQEKRPLLEASLFKFNKHVLGVEKGKGNSPLAPVHKEICEFIDGNKHKRKLLLIPRGHLKSTVVTVGYTLQAIAKNPSARILIANATYDNACSFLTEIKRHLRFNEKIQWFWGDLSANAEVWNVDSITLAASKRKEPTIKCMGVGGNLTSQHYDIIILDDLVNKDNVTSKDQIQKVINFYRECSNLLEPGGEMIIIGTRWHDSDLYGYIMDKDNGIVGDYDVFKRQAHGEGLFDEDPDKPEILFEDKFDKKHLQKLFKELGPYLYACNYLNDPVPDDQADFKQEWFQDYEPESLRGKPLNKYVMIDPAISVEKDADYTAMVTIGIDENRNIYILDIVRERFKPKQLIDQIFELWYAYSPIKIGIEDVAFQKSLQYALSQEMHSRYVYLPITPLKPAGRNKDQRIKGLQPLYANRKVLHHRGVKNILNLEDELLRFPRGKHDDIIDALSYALDLGIYPAKRKVSRPKQQRYLYG